MADAQEKVLDFPSSVREAFKEMKANEADIERLTKRNSGLKKYLDSQIPDGEIRDGVRKHVIIQKRPSWKDIYDAVYENLLPKTRQPEADLFVEKATKEVSYPTFKEVEDA